MLHNFVWHQRWTWRDRPSASSGRSCTGSLRFHLLNGTVSLAGNLAIIAVLCGTMAWTGRGQHRRHRRVLDAELLRERGWCSRQSVAAPSRWSSLGARPVDARAPDVACAELSAATIAAWQQYERQVDERYGRSTAAQHVLRARRVQARARVAGAGHGRSGVDGARAVVCARRRGTVGS